MSKKYVAKLDGKIVGKRTTQNRTYTHAIVVENVEEFARVRAYNRGAAWIKQDRDNFAYNTSLLTGRVVDEVDYKAADWKTQITAKRFAEAKAIVDAGVDAYIEAQRQRDIANFEKAKADGHYGKPFVAAWAGRLDLAQKAVSQHVFPGRRLVAIVTAEED